jgi:hypothetical protein
MHCPYDELLIVDLGGRIEHGSAHKCGEYDLIERLWKRFLQDQHAVS